MGPNTVLPVVFHMARFSTRLPVVFHVPRCCPVAPHGFPIATRWAVAKARAHIPVMGTESCLHQFGECGTHFGSRPPPAHTHTLARLPSSTQRCVSTVSMITSRRL